MQGRRVTFLDAEARLGGTFLHPGGRPATDLLLAYLSPQPGEQVLELGCGPGTTTALVAGQPDLSVVALDASPAMLRTAQRRIARAGLPARVRFVRADLSHPLRLPDGSCDAVFAESVVALLEPEPVFREIVRVLRPGGKLALNERIWRPGLSQRQVDQVNAFSTDAFGFPAATPRPLDREGWIGVLEQAGLEVVQVIPVATIPPPSGQPSVLRARLQRYRHYVAHPGLAWHQFRFKRALRRRRDEYDVLESYLFFARKPEGASARDREADHAHPPARDH